MNKAASYPRFVCTWILTAETGLIKCFGNCTEDTRISSTTSEEELSHTLTQARIKKFQVGTTFFLFMTSSIYFHQTLTYLFYLEDVQIESSRVVKGEAKEWNKLETTSHCNLIYSQTESPEEIAVSALWPFSNSTTKKGGKLFNSFCTVLN